MNKKEEIIKNTSESIQKLFKARSDSINEVYEYCVLCAWNPTLIKRWIKLNPKKEGPDFCDKVLSVFQGKVVEDLPDFLAGI